MIIALETYDEKIIDKIEKNEEVDGAVLGDMYCNYRMFPGGSAEIEDRMRQLKKAGKKVYYQTSCYLTDPLFEQTVRNICYWKQQDLLDGVFLQDVGLLHRLGQLNDGLQLIWSYMGVARNRAVNLLHYQFLRTLAPVTIAVDKPSHYRILREHGIDTMLMYGRITYATVNRLCYYTYENNLYGIDCKRACLQGKQHMINETFNLDMSVDGYLLGKKYIYTESEEYPDLLYTQNYEECMERIQVLKERE